MCCVYCLSLFSNIYIYNNNHWVNSFFTSSALCLDNTAGQSLSLCNPRDMFHRRRSEHTALDGILMGLSGKDPASVSGSLPVEF